jgi:hypothetical protein
MNAIAFTREVRAVFVEPRRMVPYAAVEFALYARVVMPGLVSGIHVLAAFKQERRGWPGRSPAMTKNRIIFVALARFEGTVF